MGLGFFVEIELRAPHKKPEAALQLAVSLPEKMLCSNMGGSFRHLEKRVAWYLMKYDEKQLQTEFVSNQT